MPSTVTAITQKIESLAPRSRVLFHLASCYYRGVISREAQLAAINCSDRVLFIGGGSCPFSAILLHQKTGAHITAIDHNANCSKKAVSVIRQLGLEGKINILCTGGDCPDLPLTSYTVVHFALQVSPLEQVFAHVERQVNPGTKLLVRKPKSSLSAAYCLLTQGIRSSCQSIAHGKISAIESTQLFVKKRQLAA